MTTAETIALIGSISTPSVAFAGYVFNAWRAGQDRQETARMAEQAQEHERRVTQGGRAYVDRGNAYRAVLTWALRTVQQVELTMPLMTFEGTPEPPESLPNDQWDAMMVEVRLFGSREVSEAMTDFRNKVSDFSGHVMVQRTYRQQGVRGIQVTESFKELQAAREKCQASYDSLADTIRDELASL